MPRQVNVLLLGAGSATMALLEFGGFVLFTVLCLSLAVRTIERRRRGSPTVWSSIPDSTRGYGIRCPRTAGGPFLTRDMSE
jgi:hypothetical protein